MTQYPEIMEAIDENVSELYNKISTIMNKRDNEAWKLQKKESALVDKFYTLGKDYYPPLNEQGVFEYTDMVDFVMAFRKIWYDYYNDELKESWGNIYHLSDHTEEDD